MSDFLELVNQRVVVYDGATGTWLQGQDLTADDFGGEALEGCNELLGVTRPDVISQLHAAYFDVGADVVETNTFGSFAIPLGEYDMPERAHERLIRKLWRDWSPGYDAREDLRDVLAAVSTSAHRSAPFDYYRSLARPWTVPDTYRHWQATLDALPTHPLLYLHGADDGCLEVGYAEKAAAGLPDLAEVVVVPDAVHFLQLEQPEVVNARIAEFLGPAAAGS